MVASRILIVQILFYINTLIWVCFATYLLVDMLAQKNGLAAVLASFFLYVNAAAMFVSGRYIGQGKKWAYYFGLFALFLNAMVTRVGQFGFFDLIALFFDITIFLGVLSIDRSYLKQS